MKALSPTRPRWTVKAILVVMGIHLISACWHILFGGMNSDEGFYAIAARSVWNGELPYRDFGYTQMPLLPYINGALMQFTGFGLFAQRAVNAFWSVLALLLAAIWLARRTSLWWALGLITFFSLSAPWMYFVHLGKTYSVVGLFAVAAFWVYLEWTSRVGKVVTLALLGTLGVGCRLPIAPYFFLLWMGALTELPEHSARSVLKSIVYSLAWPAILVLPFFVAAPEAAAFWTFGFHRATLPDRNWHLPWQVVVALAPALWLGFSGTAAHLLLQRNFITRREVVATAATLAALATSLWPAGVFEEYSVPLLLPWAMITFAGLWHAGKTVRWLRHPLVPVALLACNLGLTVAVQWAYLPENRRHSWSMFLPLKAPPYDSALPAELAQARQVVERSLAPDQPLIGPMIILAAETGRPVPQNLRLGAFSVTGEFSAARAHLLHLATFPEVEAYFTNHQIPLLALSKNPYNNYSCSMPTFENSFQYKTFLWSEFFQKNFQVAYEDDNYLILIRQTTSTLR